MSLFSRKIWDEFKVLELLRHPIPSALIILFFGIFIRGRLEKIGLANYSFIAESLVVVALIGLFIEIPHIKSFFQESLKKSIKESIKEVMPYAGPYDKESDGWFTYSDWLNQLGSLGDDLTGEHEEYSLRELLPRVYYRGHNKGRLPEPSVETVVVFFPKSYKDRTELYSVKLQRIFGRPQTERPKIFRTASTTLPSGRPNSFLIGTGKTTVSSKLFLGAWADGMIYPLIL